MYIVPDRRLRLRRLLPSETVHGSCDQGYLCDVCGQDVEAIIESDLYLRYVLGDVSPLALPTSAERHIRCNPATAAVHRRSHLRAGPLRGECSPRSLDRGVRAEQEERVTRAWRRLQEIPTLGVPITEYPLPEVSAGQMAAGEARQAASGMGERS